MNFCTISITDALKIAKSKLLYSDIKSYHIDAELLLCFALKQKKEFILLNKKRKLSLKEYDEFFNLISKRCYKAPISTIIFFKEFYGYKFFTSKNTLDPRPDSETLIDNIINILRISYKNKRIYNILDLGTGSGCLAITLLLQLPNIIATATDISAEALKTTKINCDYYNLSNRLKIIYSNWGDNLHQKYDIIISNPPYIKSADIPQLSNEVKNYDPLTALDGGADGLSCYRYIAKNLKNITHKASLIIFEIGKGQQHEITQIMQNSQYHLLKKSKDLNKIIRVLTFSK